MARMVNGSLRRSAPVKDGRLPRNPAAGVNLPHPLRWRMILKVRRGFRARSCANEALLLLTAGRSATATAHATPPSVTAGAARATAASVVPVVSGPLAALAARG